jgi:hypothetical protein
MLMLSPSLCETFQLLKHGINFNSPCFLIKVAANGTLQLGNTVRAGIYFVEVVQGKQKERLKLVKE